MEIKLFDYIVKNKVLVKSALLKKNDLCLSSENC